MELTLKRIESPFVLELKNQAGNTCLVDASQAIGGKDKGFRPMELLAGSLASCASIDVIQILKKKRIELGCYEVKINAERADAVPSPFVSIDLTFVFFNTIEHSVVDSIIQLALYKYCSVSASLNNAISINYRIEFKS